MPEFYGSEFQIDIQKRMLARHDWLAKSTEMANGGRVLNILDPVAVGWDQVKQFVTDDGTVALTAMPLEGAAERLKSVFGAGFDFPRWNVHISGAEHVLERCREILAEAEIGKGWQLVCHEKLDNRELDAVQALNLSTGVAPLPGPYLRGEVVPSVTSCLWTENGQLAAASNVTARYHPDSRFGGYVFNGSTSASPDRRGMGLGKLVTAHVLVESHRRLAWSHALAQVAPDNEPSRRMVEACGLACDPTLATFGVVRRGVTFTR